MAEQAMIAVCNNIARHRGDFVLRDIEKDFRAIFDKMARKLKTRKVLILEEA